MLPSREQKTTKPNSINEFSPLLDPRLDLDSLPSAALRRILDEVRQEDAQPGHTMYNRMHNRHNRGR